MEQNSMAWALPLGLRLRGLSPVIEVAASNLSITLGEAETSTGTVAAFSLREGLSNGAKPAFFHVTHGGGGTTGLLVGGSNTYAGVASGCAVCASDLPYSLGLSTLLGEPPVSLRTWSSADCERARIDGAGLHCAVLTAGRYVNLVNDYVTQDAHVPPSAGALADAYVSLSNFVVLSTRGGGGGGSQAASGGASNALVDSFKSTSVLAAPTANALRAAYYSLSNLYDVRTSALSNAVPAIVRAAVLALGADGASNVVSGAGSSSGSGSGSGGPAFALSNDVAIASVPDQQQRFLFAADGQTRLSAPGDGADGQPAFGWSVNDLQRDVMSLDDAGDLWVRGRVAFGPDAAAAPVLSSYGCNVGVNLPTGVDPIATLHVHGDIHADDGVYVLSDASVKTDLRPLDGALARLLRIRGLSYARTDLPADAPRQVGVIAQDVHAVLPEAVQVGADGRMSVAYGNLVALVIEAIHELFLLQGRPPAGGGLADQNYGGAGAGA
jgi:hypothetical protein